MAFGPWKNISMSIKGYFMYMTGSNWLSVFATFFVIFIFSALVYHLVEMPSQKYLKKWFLK
jgi:peptidoglycan/LPS O-acetylase OafA/YrhL